MADGYMATEKPVKKIDTKEYVKMIEDLLNNSSEVSIPVIGNSMAPFLITRRDRVLLQNPCCTLRKGDIVFFKRKTGDYVLHRISRINGNSFYMIGDAQTTLEGPIQREQIFGLVIKVQRKGIWIDKKDFWWMFFQKIWIRMIPFRPFIVKLYNDIMG